MEELESSTRKQLTNLRRDTEEKHLDTHAQIVEIHKVPKPHPNPTIPTHLTPPYHVHKKCFRKRPVGD